MRERERQIATREEETRKPSFSRISSDDLIRQLLTYLTLADIYQFMHALGRHYYFQTLGTLFYKNPQEIEQINRKRKRLFHAISDGHLNIIREIAHTHPALFFEPATEAISPHISGMKILPHTITPLQFLFFNRMSPDFLGRVLECILEKYYVEMSLSSNISAQPRGKLVLNFLSNQYSVITPQGTYIDKQKLEKILPTKEILQIAFEHGHIDSRGEEKAYFQKRINHFKKDLGETHDIFNFFPLLAHLSHIKNKILDNKNEVGAISAIYQAEWPELQRLLRSLPAWIIKFLFNSGRPLEAELSQLDHHLGTNSNFIVDSHKNIEKWYSIFGYDLALMSETIPEPEKIYIKIVLGRQFVLHYKFIDSNKSVREGTVVIKPDSVYSTYYLEKDVIQSHNIFLSYIIEGEIQNSNSPLSNYAVVPMSDQIEYNKIYIKFDFENSTLHYKFKDLNNETIENTVYELDAFLSQTELENIEKNNILLQDSLLIIYKIIQADMSPLSKYSIASMLELMIPGKIYIEYNDTVQQLKYKFIAFHKHIVEHKNADQKLQYKLPRSDKYIIEGTINSFSCPGQNTQAIINSQEIFLPQVTQKILEQHSGSLYSCAQKEKIYGIYLSPGECESSFGRDETSMVFKGMSLSKLRNASWALSYGAINVTTAAFQLLADKCLQQYSHNKIYRIEEAKSSDRAYAALTKEGRKHLRTVLVRERTKAANQRTLKNRKDQPALQTSFPCKPSIMISFETKEIPSEASEFTTTATTQPPQQEPQTPASHPNSQTPAESLASLHLSQPLLVHDNKQNNIEDNKEAQNNQPLQQAVQHDDGIRQDRTIHKMGLGLAGGALGFFGGKACLATLSITSGVTVATVCGINPLLFLSICTMAGAILLPVFVYGIYSIVNPIEKRPAPQL